VTFPADSCDDELVGVEDLVISGSVERSGDGFLLEGAVEGNARLRCARCLRELPFRVDERMALRLLPVVRAPRDEEVQLNRTDLDVLFYEEPVVDLGELAVEQVRLAVPAKPLCDEECKGLCPRCGADLNQVLCGCPRTSDPRWMPLDGWSRRG